MDTQKSARMPRILAILVLFAANNAQAYVGPGAGVGGASGMNFGTIVVIVIAGLLGLSVLCGLIAFIVAASDRIKAWISSRNDSKAADASK